MDSQMDSQTDSQQNCQFEIDAIDAVIPLNGMKIDGTKIDGMKKILPHFSPGLRCFGRVKKKCSFPQSKSKKSLDMAIFNKIYWLVWITKIAELPQFRPVQFLSVSTKEVL